MDLFNILTLIGGLGLFLFGMTVMGSSLEKCAGGSLKKLLGRLTSNRWAGFFTGLAVTAVIQSSSATTVMVVGFVNSGIMTLKQAINVIMGANVGTTVTAWLLSLTGIDGGSIFIKLLKPSSFTPLLALIGIILYMAGRTGRKKDTGLILLGFATLMFGMETMSGAVSGLRDVPEFANILLLFSNPILGVLAGALLTAIIQSSSASVGILQALASTGQVTYATAIPIIMGQNIGTCVTALLSSVGTNKNARRAAAVHLMFNIMGTAILLAVFCIAKLFIQPALVAASVDQVGIAVTHTAFNLLCTAIIMPMSGLLEKIACRIVPDKKTSEKITELDERLFATPAVAIDRSRMLTETMAKVSIDSLKNSLSQLGHFDDMRAENIRLAETEADHYEDIIGTYLVHLSRRNLSDTDSIESARLLHMIGDFERISDHAVNIEESAEELRNKKMEFSPPAKKELSVITQAVEDILDLAMDAFVHNDVAVAMQVEPLEQVVDSLKEQLRLRHIQRMQKGECSIEAGFVWSDLLTNLERVADHCSNIAVCIIQTAQSSMDMHGYLDELKQSGDDFNSKIESYAKKYVLSEE